MLLRPGASAFIVFRRLQQQMVKGKRNVQIQIISSPTSPRTVFLKTSVREISEGDFKPRLLLDLQVPLSCSYAWASEARVCSSCRKTNGALPASSCPELLGLCLSQIASGMHYQSANTVQKIDLHHCLLEVMHVIPLQTREAALQGLYTVVHVR